MLVILQKEYVDMVHFYWFQQNVRGRENHAVDNQGLHKFDDIILLNSLLPISDSAHHTHNFGVGVVKTLDCYCSSFVLHRAGCEFRVYG